MYENEMYIFISIDDVLTDSVSVSESALSQIPDLVAGSLSTVPELGIELASTQILVRCMQVLHHLLSLLKLCNP